MLLNQIAISGFSGMAPVPVEKYAIQKYFINNDLFNLLEFVNLGMGSNIGNLQATVLTYDAPSEAEFREIGNEYDADNNVPIPVTLTLKQLGGEFQTDRVLDRAFSNNPTAVSNWTEQQIGQKINAIINGFCKYFIQGDSAVDAKQFDGLKKFFDTHPGQANLTPMVLSGGLSYANALQVETFLNEAVARVVDRPTCVITSRLKGKPFLQALEQHRNRGVRAIPVYDRQYYTFMGIPIVAVDDSCFPASMTSKGIPFIFAKFAEQDGIRVAVPMNPGVGSTGAILDIVRPRMGNNGAGEAVFVRKGGVEMCSVPFIVDPFCASLCYVKETAETPLTLEVSTDLGADPELWGKTLADLQDGVVYDLANGIVRGTLKYVADYSSAGFTGHYFLAGHAEVANVTGATIKVKLNNEATLDNDGNFVLQVADPKTQILTVTAEKDGCVTSVQRYALTGLVEEPEA